MKRVLVASVLTVMLVLMTFPVRVTAKPVQSTYIPLGSGLNPNVDAYDYNGVPFLEWAWGVSVWKAPTNTPPLVPQATAVLPKVKASKIHISQSTAYSMDLTDGVIVGWIRIFYDDDTSNSIALVMGVNTAEWAYDYPGSEPAHTKISPSYSYPVTDGPAGDYYGHHFYTSIDANPAKTLKSMELELNVGLEREWLAVGISAVTIEAPYAPPGLHGAGWISPPGGEGKSTFSVSVQKPGGCPWPVGSFKYDDPVNNIKIECNTFFRLRYAYDPWAANWDVVAEGWCLVNGISGYTVTIQAQDNGNPGVKSAIKDKLQIIIAGVPSYNSQAQNLGGGNFVVLP